jgi:DHA1 family bicyclomycin/chloramphenicol resistance-like MFS transporter
VLGVSPILAPLAGSALIVPFGWRAVFVAVSIVAVLAFILMVTSLPETRPANQRLNASLGTAFAGFGQLLRHGQFLGLTFIGGFGMSSFFTFLASSSFIYIDHFGLTPTQYSFAFSINAVAFIGSSQFAATLGTRFGMARVVRWAVSAFAFFAITLFALTLAGIDSLAMIIALLFLANAGLGLVIPTTMVLALEEHGPIAGMASALGGTLQMVFGAIMIVVVSLFFDGTALPMVTTIAICALCAFLLGQITLRRLTPGPRAAEQAAE